MLSSITTTTTSEIEFMIDDIEVEQYINNIINNFYVSTKIKYQNKDQASREKSNVDFFRFNLLQWRIDAISRRLKKSKSKRIRGIHFSKIITIEWEIQAIIDG